MANLITFNSFRRGAGKSSLLSNLAALLVKDGLRVLMLDTDYQAPSLHYFFGLSEDEIPFTLNDYLAGKCSLEQVTHDLTSSLKVNTTGHLMLAPAITKTSDILAMLRNPYDFTRFEEALNQLVANYQADVALIDTTAGLNEETLVSIALANTLVVLLRPSQPDYQGTAVTIEVAQNLNVPRIFLALNDSPPSLDLASAQAELEKTYQREVLGIIPHSDDLLSLASARLFASSFPHHPLIQTFETMKNRLLAA